MTAKTSISQKDFGIKPFSAMMGAIKLRDDVDFELTRRAPLRLGEDRQKEGPAGNASRAFLVLGSYQPRVPGSLLKTPWRWWDMLRFSDGRGLFS